MTTITISFPDERAEKLQELAREKGVAPEELLRDHVEAWLSSPEPETDFAYGYSVIPISLSACFGLAAKYLRALAMLV